MMMSLENRLVSLDKNGVKIGGEYKVLLCASVFYFRLPREQWQDRIDSIVAAGYNCADIYFPWNFHEEAPNVWNFSFEKDANEFMEMCKKSGLYIIARPGPYICSEWDGGALPASVTEKGKIRCDNEEYLQSVKAWFNKILPLIKNNEFDGKSGVILLQLENELDFFDCDSVISYIGALRDMATAAKIEVPFFCCCGQSSPEKAGGFVEGVNPTYNLYPDSLDNKFDEIMRSYALSMEEKNLPFLVSETNRDHFLLRRELASGSKLMGAYNQVAGSNFGFTQSVNNWGKPLSFITTDYDFDSLVSSLGEYNHEIENAVIFASFINALGSKLSKALPYKGEIQLKTDFKTSDKINALALDGGGVAVCIPNFSSVKGQAEITFNGKKIEAFVKPMSAPFFLFDTEILGVKIEASNCEICSLSENEIVFHTDFTPCVIVAGKDVSKLESINGIRIKFISDKEAAKGKSKPLTHTETKIVEGQISDDLPKFKEVKAENDITFEGTKTYRGYLKYEALMVGGKRIFIENPADILTVNINGSYHSSFVATGENLIFDESVESVSIVAEKWGNCNFDDSRLQSMRIAAKKGISGLFKIENETKIEYCDFTLLDSFLDEKIDVNVSPTHPQLRVSSWNSTRLPVICAYSFNAERKTDKLYVSLTKKIETAVYVNGNLVQRGDYGYVDLTNHIALNKKALVTVVYRKPHWAVDCGTVSLIDLVKLKVNVSKLTENEIVKMPSGGKLVSLPLELKKGEQKVISLKVPKGKCCYIKLDMQDVKATFVASGKVVARMIGKWECLAEMKGGNEKQFYLPSDYNDGNLTAFVESVGLNPIIKEIVAIERNK